MPDVTPEMMELTATLKGKEGEEKVPLSEVIARAQKADSVEKRARENHEERRALEEARKLDEVLLTIGRNLREGLSEKSQEKLRASLHACGLSKEEADAMLGVGQSSEDEDDAEEDEEEGENFGGRGGQDRSRNGKDRNSALQQTLVQMQKQIELLQKDRNDEQDNRRKAGHRQTIDNAIDADPFLRRMLNGYTDDEEARNFVRQTVYARVAKASQSLTFGPRAIQTGLGEAKKVLSKLSGKKADSEGADDETEWEEDLVPSGLGPSRVPVGQLHRKREPIKPVSPLDKNYGDNLLKRLSAGLRKVRRG